MKYNFYRFVFEINRKNTYDQMLQIWTDFSCNLAFSALFLAVFRYLAEKSGRNHSVFLLWKCSKKWQRADLAAQSVSVRLHLSAVFPLVLTNWKSWTSRELRVGNWSRERVEKWPDIEFSYFGEPVTGIDRGVFLFCPGSSLPLRPS